MVLNLICKNEICVVKKVTSYLKGAMIIKIMKSIIIDGICFFIDNVTCLIIFGS